MEGNLEDAVNFEITPTISAVHSCGINACAATKNFKWLLTGGDDGFIRKFDVVASLNGNSNLTGLQRQGLVDSIQKGGVLISAWENEEIPSSTTGTPSDSMDVDQMPPPLKVSPVFSLDVHSEAVWCVSGTESGFINLYTVRHQEGKNFHVLRGHTGPVSALKITPNERELISGSWDKTIRYWNLDTGALVSEFKQPTSHISNLEFCPTSASNVSERNAKPNQFLATSTDGNVYIYDLRAAKNIFKKITATMANSPPWALSACWNIQGDKIYIGRRNSVVDEYDVRSNTFTRKLTMPNGSGPVSSVLMLPNSRHLLVASDDNIRLWDLEYDTLENNPTAAPSPIDFPQPVQDNLFTSFADDPFELQFFSNAIEPEKVSKKQTNDQVLEHDFSQPSMPFSIVPGHHGGYTSSMRKFWLTQLCHIPRLSLHLGLGDGMKDNQQIYVSGMT